MSETYSTEQVIETLERTIRAMDLHGWQRLPDRDRLRYHLEQLKASIGMTGATVDDMSVLPLGIQPSGKTICPDCEGKGHLEKYEPMESLICPACGGTGKEQLPAVLTCEACGGTGYNPTGKPGAYDPCLTCKGWGISPTEEKL